MVRFITLVMTMLAAAPWLQAAENESLCAASERSYFSCETAIRLVSVCGGKTHGASYVQLRYGHLEQLEASWPPPEANRKAVTKGSVISQGALGLYIRFAIDNDALVVFDVPGAESGLVTIEASKIKSKELCRVTHTSDLADAPVADGSIFAVSVDASASKH